MIKGAERSSPDPVGIAVRTGIWLQPGGEVRSPGRRVRHGAHLARRHVPAGRRPSGPPMLRDHRRRPGGGGRHGRRRAADADVSDGCRRRRRRRRSARRVLRPGGAGCQHGGGVGVARSSVAGRDRGRGRTAARRRPSNEADRATAADMDRADVLGAVQEIVFRTIDRGPIYMDGNSLGRMSFAGRQAIADGVTTWAERAVGGWSEWIDLPVKVGDKSGGWSGRPRARYSPVTRRPSMPTSWPAPPSPPGRVVA